MNKLKNENSIKHVAIIMDGNGRWATQRSRPRVWGHIRGSSKVADIVECANNSGVGALTLYAFSSENWSRPQSEVSVLFSLLYKFLQKEKLKILKNNIKFRIMGDISSLPKQTKDLINELENSSKDNTGLKLTFAFSYGARLELTRAFNLIQKNLKSSEITEKDINDHLYIPELGDVDLLIRTGGDYRISNFLLWQIAYAELFFTNTKWPDFTSEEFLNILKEVLKRERRFGGISNSIKLES